MYHFAASIVHHYVRKCYVRCPACGQNCKIGQAKILAEIPAMNKWIYL